LTSRVAGTALSKKKINIAPANLFTDALPFNFSREDGSQHGNGK